MFLLYLSLIGRTHITWDCLLFLSLSKNKVVTVGNFRISQLENVFSLFLKNKNNYIDIIIIREAVALEHFVFGVVCLYFCVRRFASWPWRRQHWKIVYVFNCFRFISPTVYFFGCCILFSWECDGAQQWLLHGREKACHSKYGRIKAIYDFPRAGGGSHLYEKK